MSVGRIPGASGIPTTTVLAKGDLIAGTAANAVTNLSVGTDGQTLVADSSTSTGLRYQGNFAAGKNKIINGDFGINQRAFTSNTTDGAFNFDRFFQGNTNVTQTVTPQTFTAGAAPVAGYEGKNYVQSITSGGSTAGDFAALFQTIEDVRSYANQTVTVSFWAQAGSATPKIGIGFTQYFGSGGSANVTVSGTAVTTSTAWTRYNATFSIPTISGKTIGTGSYLRLNLWLSTGTNYDVASGTIGFQNNTFRIWGVQVEAGSTATSFQTATGTIQGELAACMRYAEKLDFTSGVVLTVGQAYSSSAAWGGIAWTTQKRTTPTITQTGTIQALQANTATSGTTFAYGTIGINSARMEHSGGSSLNAGDAVIFQTSGAASLLITAEL